MESLFIIGSLWLFILVAGLGMLLARLFRLDEVIEQFGQGVQILKARPLRGWMFLMVAAGVLTSLFISWILGKTLGLGDMEEERMMLVATGLQIVIGYGLFLWVLHVIRRLSEGGLSPLFGSVSSQPGGFPFSRGVRYYIMAMPGIALAAFTYFKLLEVLGVPQVQQPIMELLSGLDSPLLILAMGIFAVVLAPIVEELVFRGMLLPLLSRRLGLAAGIVISSLLFALLHGHLQTMFPLMVVAIFFSFGYIFGKSIWVPIIMHASFNGMNLLTVYLQKGGV
jgi:membrane protease YdiL (CAAX protease family)